MLDINFIRDNKNLVEKSTRDRGYNVDIGALLKLDTERRELQSKIDNLRERRNTIAAQMKNGKPEPKLIDEGKEIKTELAKLESKMATITSEWQKMMALIPNVNSPDTPIGGEDASVEVRAWGEHMTGAISHLDFAEKRGWVDFKRGANVAGSKFYYLMGELAELQAALYQYGLRKVINHGFNFMDVPYMVNSRTMVGTGFAPRTSEQSDEYAIDGEDLQLIATAEIPLTGYHSDEIIDESRLPLLYAGYSPCFRREAGAAGKHNHGLFRVHQFNKLEMYVFCTPEQSTNLHEKILAIEEEIWQELGIPYHVINIASGDMGAPAYKKYDIEYWSPVDGVYRELTSCSNCTDYQARNLNIRVRRDDGRIEILHTLNGTAISMARTLVAILENYQNSDGTLSVPKTLRPYMDGRQVI